MSLPAPAAAQTSAEVAVAKGYFKDAEEAEKRGDCASARTKFQQVLAIKETP